MIFRVLCTCALAVLLVPVATAHAASPTGAVYTMTNAAGPNELVIFDRYPDGSLVFSGKAFTGGEGSGDGLGNQGGVVLSDNGRWLLLVNAGSNEVSVFSTRQQGQGPVITDVVPSGGVRPISVAVQRNLVYVLHAGGSVGDVDGIHGFRLGQDGTLTPIPDSFRTLSAPSTAPAQIGFTPDGRFLVVTEKATNNIDLFPLFEGIFPETAPGPIFVNPSVGQTPFAFDFGKKGVLIVSEAAGGAEDAGSVTSYEVGQIGDLFVIDPSVPNTETAPCWLKVSRGGKYAFTTNTPDDSLSAYAIDSSGHLELLDEDGRTGEPGMGTRPLDMDITHNGRFLYTLNIGTDTISNFAVMPDGSLELLGAAGGVPDGANGLAAR